MPNLDFINRKFDALGNILLGEATRTLRIVGPPGIGKTEYVIRHLARNHKPFQRITGHISPVTLYVKLYERRGEDQTLLLDDSDQILIDPNGIPLIKHATDTNAERKVNWHTMNKAFEEAEIPTEFQFNGRLIMISNQMLDNMSRSIRIRTDLQAIENRMPHFNFEIANNSPAILTWIHHMALEVKILEGEVPDTVVKQFIDYIDAYKFTNRIKVPGLRTLTHLSRIWKDYPDAWDSIAEGMEI